MSTVTIIGVDLAKNIFQLHGAAADGSVVFRKKLARPLFRKFIAVHPPCIVAMEACTGSHYWSRELVKMGHEPKLIAPRFVKPFLKRHKNDAADAEAIVEAALRPTMRFVEPKTVEQQSRAILFRTREQLVSQRTELVNALRAHLYEFGYIAPHGIGHVSRLEDILTDDQSNIPDVVRQIGHDLLEHIRQITDRVNGLNTKIDALSSKADTTRRLRTMPGVGPITALAIETFAPAMQVFKRGRDFAAWLGLVPLQHSSGGKQRLGKISKAGQRGIRRLLIVGAMAVVRWACRKGAPPDSWLGRMLDKKPRMLVAIALANKMARGIWAMLTNQVDFRTPAAMLA